MWYTRASFGMKPATKTAFIHSVELEFRFKSWMLCMPKSFTNPIMHILAKSFILKLNEIAQYHACFLNIQEHEK